MGGLEGRESAIRSKGLKAETKKTFLGGTVERVLSTPLVKMAVKKRDFAFRVESLAIGRVTFALLVDVRPVRP